MPAGEALVDATDPLPPSLLGPGLIRRTYPNHGSRWSRGGGLRFSRGNGYFTGFRDNLKPIHGFLNVGCGMVRCVEPNWSLL